MLQTIGFHSSLQPSRTLAGCTRALRSIKCADGCSAPNFHLTRGRRLRVRKKMGNSLRFSPRRGKVREVFSTRLHTNWDLFQRLTGQFTASVEAGNVDIKLGGFPVVFVVTKTRYLHNHNQMFVDQNLTRLVVWSQWSRKKAFFNQPNGGLVQQLSQKLTYTKSASDLQEMRTKRRVQETWFQSENQL